MGYLPIGGGIDASAYWLDFADAKGNRYTLTVDLPAEAGALPALVARRATTRKIRTARTKTLSIGSVAINIDGNLDARDSNDVISGLTPVSVGAFSALADAVRTGNTARGLDRRTLNSADGKSTITASVSGGLGGMEFGFAFSDGGGDALPLGAWAIGMPMTHTARDGNVVEALLVDQRTTSVRIVVDGHDTFSGTPTTDPYDANVRIFFAEVPIDATTVDFVPDVGTGVSFNPRQALSD